MTTSRTKLAPKTRLNSKENILQKLQHAHDTFPAIWEYQQTGTAIDENGDAFRVYLTAPGLEKDDFKVSLDEGLLEIEALQIQTGYQVDDSAISVLFRTLNLPKNVNASLCRASYKEDVLQITIPKRRKSIVDKRTRILVN